MLFRSLRFGNAPLGSLLITKLSDDSKHEPLSEMCIRDRDMAKTPFPWIGSKEKIAPYILQLFPPKLTQYVEPFGGLSLIHI